MSHPVVLEETGWTFRVEEVSANVYRVTGSDSSGHRVEATGADPDRLLEDCRRDAMGLMDGAGPCS